ncbi:SDR family NAD(P)-dependent oxidoreductase [bacterium SCSIO 12741]|nr:SDR family NAD(P)-dependent oxidoreductase [bacterium SCSIO 12741]
MRKVMLITGASSGIGKVAAQHMNKLGWKVYATARRVDKMQDLQKQGCEVLAMDVTQDDTMVAGINEILQKEGKIDALINNAGYGSYGSLEDVPIDEGRYQFEVNVIGLARLTQLVLPHMRGAKAGRIINISSIGGKFGEPHGAWYHGTKWAVEGMSDSLRMELKQFGIDVVVIEPGAINSEWSGIAQTKLLETSGDTAYGNLARKHVNMLKKYDGQGSDPIVIAKAIEKACEASKPKTRYVVGKGSSMFLTVKKLLSDRGFDKMMLNQMK